MTKIAISRHSHPTDELRSWLQKSIRRGEKFDAVYCAVELDLSGNAEIVWNCLKTVVSEDCGLAAPGLAADIHALYLFWKEAKNTSSRLHIIHAVLECCYAQKSRLVDNALIAVYSSEQKKREVPDWALDKHTKRGAMLGRGFDHFFSEGAKLENEDMSFSNPAMERLAKDICLRKEKSTNAPE